MKKVNILYGFILVIIFLTIAVFVYPTIYKYDKLDQKYPVKINRITGDAQVLTMKGWIEFESMPSNEATSLRDELIGMIDANKSELYNKLEQDRSELVDNIAYEVEQNIKDKIIRDVTDELDAVKKDINQYKKFETNSSNYFTIGSTKEEVKKIMGVPTSINDYIDTWYYNSSSICFNNGKVESYDNHSDNLRIR